MTNLRNITEAPTGSSHTVRWPGEELAKIEEAARILSARQQLRITKTDIIRRGALREAAAILDAERLAA